MEMSLSIEDEIIKACDEFGIDPSEMTDQAARTKLIKCVEAELLKQEAIYTALEQMKWSQEKFSLLNSVEDVPNVSERRDESEDLTSDVVEAIEDNATRQASSDTLPAPTAVRPSKPSTSSTTPARLSLKGARTLLDQQYEKRLNDIKENLQGSLTKFAGIKKVNDYKKSYEAHCPPFIPDNQSFDFLSLVGLNEVVDVLEQTNEQPNEDDQVEQEADMPQAANIHEQSRLPPICQLCETDVTTVFQILTVDDVKQCICHKCHIKLLHKKSQHNNESQIAQIVEKNNLNQANLRRDYFDMIRSPRKMERFRKEQCHNMRQLSNVQQPIVQKATLNSNNSNFKGPNKQILDQTTKQSAAAHLTQKSTQYKRKLEPKQVLPASKFLSQAGTPPKKQQKNQPIDFPTGKQREQTKTHSLAATNYVQNAPLIQPRPRINITPNLAPIAPQPQYSTKAVPLNMSLQQQQQNELQVMQNIYAQQILQANMQSNPVLMQMIQNMMVQNTPESPNATNLSLNDNSSLLSSSQTNQLVNSVATSSSTVNPIPSSSSSINQPGPSTSRSIDPPPPAGNQYNPMALIMCALNLNPQIAANINQTTASNNNNPDL